MSLFAKFPPYKFILAAVDSAIAALAIYLTFVSLSLQHDFASMEFTAPVVVSALVTFLVFQAYDLYKVRVFSTFAEQIRAIAKSLVYISLSMIVLAVLFSPLTVFTDPAFVFSFWTIHFSLSFVFRTSLRPFLKSLGTKKLVRHNVLIYGATETGRNLAVNLFLFPHGTHVIGFVDDELPLGRHVFSRLKVIGRGSELKEIVDVFDVDEIVVCLEDTTHGHLIEVLDKAIHTKADVKIASPLYQVVPLRLRIERYGKMPVVSVTHSAPGSVKEFYKRVSDIVLGSILIVLISPVLAAIALAIRMDSPGSAIFRQVRIGKNGKPFNFYKFRSMAVGSDNDEQRRTLATDFIRNKNFGNGSSTKIVNEAKVTRVGKWLRQTSLDELPQLFNVIRGDMSLVGPRPCLPYEWDHYEEWHKRRLSVLPGCTGVWQVSGRSAVGFDDMVVLDLYYIQNLSFLLDVRLILKTIPVMVMGTGAK